MSTQPIDYAALAKQAGAISSSPAPSQPTASKVDYAALAKQAGAISSDMSNATQKMVSPSGQVVYANPDQVQGLKQSGHTLINPDGSFYLQNIPGEDPLDEAKRRERVYQALTPQEKSGALHSELKEGATTGGQAALATAAGVAGASGLGAASDATATFWSEVGKHIATRYAGQSAAKITADFLIENAGKLALGSGLTGYLIHKLTSAGKP